MKSRPLLDRDDMAARIATADAATTPDTPERRWIKPLGKAANLLVEQITNPEGRFMFGIDRLDIMIRGIGPGELCYITGRPHSGKTQVLLNAVTNNPQARVLWFTPDEPAELVLMKLCTMVHGIKPEDLEDAIKSGSQTHVDMVHNVAQTEFPNLIVVDAGTNTDQMTVALSEAVDHWQAPADLCVFDFLELMPGDGDASGVAAKSQAVKRWGKDSEVPLVVVHQSSRSGGNRGEAAGMDGMRYGGESDATYVLEVFRKRDNEKLSEHETQSVSNMVTVNVAKNKRPPCHVGEVDLFMHPSFGLVREMRDGDDGTPLAYRSGSQADMIKRLKEDGAATGPQADPSGDSW